jgi:hypothetical protein
MVDGRTKPVTPDLFSMTPDREPDSPSLNPRMSALSDLVSPPRHVLPRDLPSAIKQLDDQELERLIGAALAEQRRRGTKPVAATEPSRKQRAEAVESHLTTGKLNAVRAAFRAGVKPTQIARQFGLSDADVRRALASDEKKR